MQLDRSRAVGISFFHPAHTDIYGALIFSQLYFYQALARIQEIS